jgi:hypothetical protein
MKKIFASPKKIPAHFLKKDGVESFDLWFDVLHKRDESDSWLDILKLRSSDGSVAGMPNFIRFSNRIFQDDKEGTSSDSGAMFQTNNGTVVIVRPHFDAQQKFSRVGNHRDYPLKDVILGIDNNVQGLGNYTSFVSAGKKNKEGEGNVDATLNYTIQGIRRPMTGSNLLNRTVAQFMIEVYPKEDLSAFSTARKVIILNSVHGFKEYKKQGNVNFRNIWPETWQDNEQLQDRQKRLGGKK